MAQPSNKAGLEDVVALTSDICFIDGQEGRLLYRGYDIEDLVEHSCFEEVAYLLWHGNLPTTADLDALRREFAAGAPVPPGIVDYLRTVPRGAATMSVLRTAVSALGLYDGEADEDSREANLRKSVRLTAQIPVLIAAYERIRNGQSPLEPRSDLDLAQNFLYMLQGEVPNELSRKAMDVCLILHADHELNASTFAARVTTATLSDIYSAITSGIGALKGPLHGGANQAVMEMLQKIGNPQKAKAWVREALDRKERIPGFGHRVYKTDDPRAIKLKVLSKQLGEQAGNTNWYEMSETIQHVIREEKGLFPNVDFYSATTYFSMGIPTHLYTPVFAFSRMAGWTAHILEQYGNNRLIRPRAEYVGPTRMSYVPVQDRN